MYAYLWNIVISIEIGVKDVKMKFEGEKILNQSNAQEN